MGHARPGEPTEAVGVAAAGVSGAAGVTEVATISEFAAVSDVAAATGSPDPQVGLAAVAALRGLVEVLEALQVEHARAQGWTWAAIAERLAVSKQAVHQKHAPGRLFRSGR